MKLQNLFLALFFRRFKYDFDDSFLIPLTRVHILILIQLGNCTIVTSSFLILMIIWSYALCYSL